MQIFSLLAALCILLSPVLFWMYLLQSFPQLGVGRRQFLIGMSAGALTTIPLVYNDIWLVGGLLENIFFRFSYISESLLGLEIFLSLIVFFAVIFILTMICFYLLDRKIYMTYISSCIGFTLIAVASSVSIYGLYFFMGSSESGLSTNFGGYIFQGFALIFGYYMIISLLEEGLKYFGNTQVMRGNMPDLYTILGFACATGLGFAFFENILYAYNFYMNSQSTQGIFELIFFRSIFTVSLHILCALLLASGLYIFSIQRHKTRYMYVMLFALSGGAILSHSLFNTALTYGYMGVIFLYILALYICIVSITAEGGAESSL